MEDAMKMMGMFAPGFEFMKALSQAASQGSPMPAAPAVGSWAAPSLDPAEVQKKIDDLKAVKFWLSQNAAVLDASIQALEVQRMTLSTLKGMEVDFSALGRAMEMAPPAAAGSQPSPMMDPVKMWGALSEQFMLIAQGALAQMPAMPASMRAPAAPAASKPAAKKAASKARAKR